MLFLNSTLPRARGYRRCHRYCEAIPGGGQPRRWKLRQSPMSVLKLLFYYLQLLLVSVDPFSFVHSVILPHLVGRFLPSFLRGFFSVLFLPWFQSVFLWSNLIRRQAKYSYMLTSATLRTRQPDVSLLFVLCIPVQRKRQAGKFARADEVCTSDQDNKQNAKNRMEGWGR